MSRRPRFWLLPPVLLSMSFWCLGVARASLGGDAASIAADAAGLQGADQLTPLRSYDIHQITTDSGMRVREFINHEGIVFAVSWTGPAMPDLQALLGASFPRYSAAVAALNQRALHRSVQVQTAELIAASGGHMRAYGGYAFVPALLPTGASPAELR